MFMNQFWSDNISPKYDDDDDDDDHKLIFNTVKWIISPFLPL